MSKGKSVGLPDLVESTTEVYIRCLKYRKKNGSEKIIFTKRDYDQHKTPEEPASKTIYNRFGSWSEAMRISGIPYAKPYNRKE